MVITVAVTTRNRPESLLRCLRSLELIEDLVGEVLVADDGSDPPVRDLLDRVSPRIAARLQLIEMTSNEGYIVGRNRMARLAANDCILSLDDDAHVLDGDAIRRAVELFGRRPLAAAVACAQAEADGRPWPPEMQPARASVPCVVAAYIGFAHLLRRSAFLKLGGYREIFHYYGEEKDYCLRALNAGLEVVYLPDSLVAHVPDQSGRITSRYLRYAVRNDCLSALFNEPVLLAMVTIPLRLRRYARMRDHAKTADPGGLAWIVRELAASLPTVLRNRTPVRWATIRQWHRVRRNPVALAAPSRLRAASVAA
jgi:GT2 family glycosyltransferase